MSTSAQTGIPTYTGVNGSNGTAVTAQPSHATNFVASSPAVAATYVNVAVSPATAQPTYVGGANGSNGFAVAGHATAGSLGTQGAAASGSNGPTGNPGS